MLNNSDSDLSQKQERAIVALLHEPTVLKAAQVAKINERTIYRWLEEPAYIRRASGRANAQSAAWTLRTATESCAS